MRFLATTLVLFAATVLGRFSGRVKYSNSPVLRLDDAKSENTQSVIKALENNLLVDKWDIADIRVDEKNLAQVKMILAENSVSYSVYIEDVQSLIDEEEKQMLHSPVSAADFFESYHTYEEILTYLDTYVSKYPQLIAKTFVGNSFEGRDIWAYNITSDRTISKPSVLLEFGIHSREWIATAVGPYIFSKLIDGYNSADQVAQTALKSFNWYFIPVVNPDGFEYTHTKDRMWRKTRSTRPGVVCVGVDPNRNWGDHWCSEIDCSKQACSDSYAGPYAFSEIEVKSVADYLTTLHDLKIFVDFHSYSQLWMSPYGWTTSLPADYKTQSAAGQLAVAAIKKSSGLTYDEGPIATIIYPASGSSADYVYDTVNATWSYGVELRDQGQYGFLLPANQIKPCGEEVYASLVALSTYVSQQ